MWNLSSDQGNLGSFFLTNVRLVWHANLASNFNVSLPYMQVKSLRIRDSKFGFALVVETFARSGGYILGFRIDPKEKLEEVYKEVLSLHQVSEILVVVCFLPNWSSVNYYTFVPSNLGIKVFAASPIFGVDFSVEAEAPSIEKITQPRIEEDVEITEDENQDSHAVAAYYVEGSAGADAEGGTHGEIVFDSKLGLAVEAMQSGITLDSLWRVV